MIFANLFAITSTPQHIQDVKEMVLSLLEDEQLEVLFIVLYMKLTEIVTIQMKASEQCFSVMLWIRFYGVIIQMKATIKHFSLVPLIVLRKVALTFFQVCG